MKPDIDILRRHGMNKHAVKEQAEALARSLTRQAPGRYGWDEDTLVFSGGGARGVLHVGDDFIHFQMITGPVLRVMRGRIQSTVEAYLDKHVA